MVPPTTEPDLLRELTERVARLEERADRAPDPDALCLLVYGGELDRLLAAFTMATGAAASGMRVTMFFTFWGTPALRRPGSGESKRPFMERLMGRMIPGGLRNRRLSKLDFGGAGRWMIERRMKQLGICGLPELVELAGELGVEIVACEMSMSLMGIREEDLIDYPHLEIAGVASFLDAAARSATNLFV